MDSVQSRPELQYPVWVWVWVWLRIDASEEHYLRILIL